MIIRQENTDDFKDIFETICQAFGQKEEALLVELLRKSEEYIPALALVAIYNTNIVGHILFSSIKIIAPDNKEFESIALAPLAVKPEFQNNGFGSALIRHGLNKARELGYKSVIVLGHKQYYPKFGFAPAINWNIKAPFDVESDHFMAIELVPNALQNVQGMVKYSNAFDS